MSATRRSCRCPKPIHRMTGLAASQIGIRDRGLIRDRHIADLVVFNPDTVTDTATYERPHQYPTGIEYVVVNGVTVLEPKGFDRRAAGPAGVRAGSTTMTRLRHHRRPPPSPRLRRTSRRGRLRLPMVATLITATLVVWPPRLEVQGQTAVGRVTGRRSDVTRRPGRCRRGRRRCRVAGEAKVDRVARCLRRRADFGTLDLRVRPVVFRRSFDGEWQTQMYELALRYERAGPDRRAIRRRACLRRRLV